MGMNNFSKEEIKQIIKRKMGVTPFWNRNKKRIMLCLLIIVVIRLVYLASNDISYFVIAIVVYSLSFIALLVVGTLFQVTSDEFNAICNNIDQDNYHIFEGQIVSRRVHYSKRNTAILYVLSNGITISEYYFKRPYQKGDRIQYIEVQDRSTLNRFILEM